MFFLGFLGFVTTFIASGITLDAKKSNQRLVFMGIPTLVLLVMGFLGILGVIGVSEEHQVVAEGELIGHPGSDLVTNSGFLYRNLDTGENDEVNRADPDASTHYYVEGDKGYVSIEARTQPTWYIFFPGMRDYWIDKEYTFWLPTEEAPKGIELVPLPDFAQ